MFKNIERSVNLTQNNIKVANLRKTKPKLTKEWILKERILKKSYFQCKHSYTIKHITLLFHCYFSCRSLHQTSIFFACAFVLLLQLVGKDGYAKRFS